MDDDGVALQATNHPLEITEEMLAAGAAAIHEGGWEHPSVDWVTDNMLKAVFTAMVYAGPPEPGELNEAALEAAFVQIELHKEIVEQFAIRCALGNNGGEWAEHYTPEQKEHWRQFVRELADDLMAAPKQVKTLLSAKHP